MRRAFRVPDVRAAEAATGPLLVDGVLMARAAHALAVVSRDVLGGAYGTRVCLLVGGGDNGGDALLAGATLARQGARVDALLAGRGAHEAGAAALLAAGGRVHPAGSASGLDALDEADLVLDGITGIGGRGGLREGAARLAGAVPATAVVLAVDVPSGVDADTGEVPGVSVRADATLTFGAVKPGLLVDPGAHRAGVVLLADIGLGAYLPSDAAVESFDADDVAVLLRAPRADDDKYSRGVLGVAAGSDGYTGAGVLCVAGALGAGPGMVRFASTSGAASYVRARHPEAIVTDVDTAEALAEVGRVQAWVVGPGGGTDARAADVLAAILATDLPVVVDADALTLLARRPELVEGRDAPTVLTPHAGELARLLGTDRAGVEDRRMLHVDAVASRFGATVLLKGSATLVATVGRPLRANPAATPWLATAGSGDVLAGAIGALLAAGLDPHDAASAGAWLHARAGAEAAGGGPLRAGAVAAALPGVVAALLDGSAEGESPA